MNENNFKQIETVSRKIGSVVALGIPLILLIIAATGSLFDPVIYPRVANISVISGWWLIGYPVFCVIASPFVIAIVLGWRFFRKISCSPDKNKLTSS